jgi:hypothetical protein
MRRLPDCENYPLDYQFPADTEDALWVFRTCCAAVCPKFFKGNRNRVEIAVRSGARFKTTVGRMVVASLCRPQISTARWHFMIWVIAARI